MREKGDGLLKAGKRERMRFWNSETREKQENSTLRLSTSLGAGSVRERERGTFNSTRAAAFRGRRAAKICLTELQKKRGERVPNAPALLTLRGSIWNSAAVGGAPPGVCNFGAATTGAGTAGEIMEVVVVVPVDNY